MPSCISDAPRSRGPGRWGGLSGKIANEKSFFVFKQLFIESMVPKHFFHRVLVCILTHKKTWIKKIIPAGRSIHRKAATSAKIWQNSTENFSKHIFSKIQWKFRKIKIFDFSKFSLNFRENIFRKIFGQVLSIFWSSALTLTELISKLECFFWSRFFCGTRYTLVVYGKNCLGDVAAV